MSGNTRGKPITVRVLIYLTSDSQYAVGIITSEWQGAVRVDRRLARIRPVADPLGRPLGVDPDVWRAYCALDGLIEEQKSEAERRL